LITSSVHPLAQNKQISLSDAAEELFILPPLSHNMREIAIKACRISGFEPKIACECTQHNTLFNLVANGFGISFISSQFIDAALSAGLRVIPFDPLIERTLCLAVIDAKHQSPAISVFRDFILKILADEEKTLGEKMDRVE
jgi:LysR family transcriptional activator of glutamate synthase operon